MTTAANGLRLSASAPALALADMNIEDIIAQMSEDQRSALVSTLASSTGSAAPAPADPEDDDDAGMTPEEKAKKKNDKMSGGDTEAAAEARGFAAASARFVAVMSSEHFEGRTAQALKLLGNAKLSADEIINMLADMPDGSGAAMLAAMRSQNPNLGTGIDASGGAPTNADNHGWGVIHARVAARYGRKPN